MVLLCLKGIDVCLLLQKRRHRVALQVFRRKAVPRGGSRWFEEPGMFVTFGTSELRRGF